MFSKQHQQAKLIDFDLAFEVSSTVAGVRGTKGLFLMVLISPRKTCTGDVYK